MEKLILVAGATGHLGQKICRELIKRNVHVRAIVREQSEPKKVDALEKMGVDIFKVDMDNEQELIGACAGVNCIVSALAGLREVIVDTQTKLLNAAVAAGVPHFIPSDFSSDFTTMPAGENRNFDLRKEFHAILDNSPIRSTSIFNGAFADILRYNTPLFNVQQKTISYYDNKVDWAIDFTTMDDTAAFTAMVALDEAAPQALRIASFRISPNDLVSLSEQYKGSKFDLIDMGSMEGFSAYNKTLRAAHPEGENELYPKWQQAQYLYSMFLVHHTNLDNDRYEGLSWSPVATNI
ncbi:NmrA family NAD(P)-binding protein [Mucilaginibacter psychrotolerans]|uniref:NAD-dependent epimerase/dehydratase family protein n=1 Tax=Mucilaginibacter psychrotolerans TaxID=1524096 RepID=A0A4Y8S6C2_9SPHI|nr:NmrA family NAD(P)-binding protein [Mucilaginibacter psychrotolerans]TFF34145.1 NAD-dependent epimerase/dehydratase family protein [Mucilaginibacter psychrotolerans]